MCLDWYWNLVSVWLTLILLSWCNVCNYWQLQCCCLGWTISHMLWSTMRFQLTRLSTASMSLTSNKNQFVIYLLFVYLIFINRTHTKNMLEKYFVHNLSVNRSVYFQKALTVDTSESSLWKSSASYFSPVPYDTLSWVYPCHFCSRWND